MSNLVYYWDLTPKELLSCLVPVNSQDRSRIQLPTVPFKLPKLSLIGTPYTYQLGVSDSSSLADVALIHKEIPSLPHTGDRRTGIIVYNGSKIIGTYLIPGHYTRDYRLIYVHENYRNQGLGTRMLEQWYREVPRVMNLPPQLINIMAAKTSIKAHANVVRWAIAEGKDVPQRVQDAINNGAEVAEILARLDVFEKAPARKLDLSNISTSSRTPLNKALTDLRQRKMVEIAEQKKKNKEEAEKLKGKKVVVEGTPKKTK